MANPIWRIVGMSVIAHNIVSEAVASLRRRRMQVALSSFGIATGIAAVVLLVSIVSGMHRYAIEQIGAVGGNIIRVGDLAAIDARSARVQGDAADDRSGRRARGRPAYDIGMAENSGFGVVRTPRRSSREGQVRGVTDRASSCWS